MEVRDLVRSIRKLSKEPGTNNPDVWPALCKLEHHADLEVVGHALAQVTPESISSPNVKFKPLRIGVVSSFTAEGIVPVLRAQLLAQGIAPEFYIAGYSQIAFELSNPVSELAQFEPNVTLCLLHDQFFLPKDWNTAAPDQLRGQSQAKMDELYHLINGFTARQPGSVILNTVPLSAHEAASVIAIKNKALLGRVWREVNTSLLEMSERLTAAYVIDLEQLLTDHPGRLQDARLYRYASMAWHNDVVVLMAREVTNVCRAVLGLSKKCLVLDLDNTMWGGVIGDDGPSGIQIGEMYPGNCYLELQRMAKRLQQQGVILAVCSKNEASIVQDTFKNHPDLLLREEDFAVMVANWQPKNQNISNIATQLNIGQDALVFVDDSSFECELVSQTLPDVTVVHLGQEPAQHVEEVVRAGYFNVLVTTQTDQERTEMYRTQVKRQEFAHAFQTPEDYLRQLEISVGIFTANDYSLPRLSQLNLRTNQFNMTTIRYSEAEMRAMHESDDTWILGFESSDRFGKEGIVGGVWVKKHDHYWEIENFIMSCRVFSRKIEHSVLQYVIDQARAAGILRIEAEYRPTAKNKVVNDFYPSVGFTVLDESEGRLRYELNLDLHASIAPDWVNLEVKEGEVLNV